MSVAPAGAGRDPGPIDVAPLLEDTAPAKGGRNQRPDAVPALVRAHLATGRTWMGAGAAGMAALAGAGVWFGLAQREEADASLVLTIAAFAVAVGLLAGAGLLGRRSLVEGSRMLTALRQWYAIAPEVPVRGIETVTGSAGRARVVVGGLGLLAAVGALVVAVLLGSLPAWAGLGVAAVACGAAGATALRGWSRVRTLLRSAAPQRDHAAFAPAEPAPAPGAQPQPWQHGAPAQPWQQGHAQQYQQPGQPYTQPGQPYQQPGQPYQQAPVAQQPWQQGQPQQPQQSWQQPQQQPVPPQPSYVEHAEAGQTTLHEPLPHGPLAQTMRPSEAWGPPDTLRPDGTPAVPTPGRAPLPPATPPPAPSTAAPAAIEPDIDETVIGTRRTLTSPTAAAPRWVVELADGRTLRVDAVTLVGRSPRPRPEEASAEVVAIEDGTVSKTHAAIRVAADSVHVTDRASTNGTVVVDAQGARRTLQPWAEESVALGSEILVGSYRLRVRTDRDA